MKTGTVVVILDSLKSTRLSVLLYSIDLQVAVDLRPAIELPGRFSCRWFLLPALTRDLKAFLLRLSSPYTNPGGLYYRGFVNPLERRYEFSYGGSGHHKASKKVGCSNTEEKF